MGFRYKLEFNGYINKEWKIDTKTSSVKTELRYDIFVVQTVVNQYICKRFQH